jgi:hypothetical protein
MHNLNLPLTYSSFLSKISTYKNNAQNRVG